MRLELSDSYRLEIARAVEQVRAGTVKPDLFHPDLSPAQRLRKKLRDAQRLLVSWKACAKPRERGYLYFPDCAGALLLECRATRRVLRDLGEPIHENPEPKKV